MTTLLAAIDLALDQLKLGDVEGARWTLIQAAEEAKR
jgi:hypothetical protein